MILKRSLARTGTRFLPALTVAILLTRFLPIWTPVWAAVTFDNATDLGTTTGTSLSGSHTMGAGSGGILFVCIHSPAVSINVNNVSGVTFNSVALTEDIDTHSSGDTGYNAQIWRLNGPASGSHTLAITLSSTSAVISAHVVSYTGAASTGQPDASHSVGTGCCPTTGTDSVTTVTANDWGVSCTWGQFAQPTISTGLVNSREASNNILTADTGVLATAGAHSYTVTSASNAFSMTIDAFAPAAGGGSGPCTLTTLGAGKCHD